MRILVAPDSFKGSADAAEVAESIGRGWSLERPEDEVVLLPMADGGEGTLDAFETAVPGSERRFLRVSGPTGEAVEASWLLLPDGTAVVELASTSGITLLAPDDLRPQDATTRGFGEAIADALAAGATRLLLAVGSSCSTDGGAGALEALGAVFRTAEGLPIEPGARGLATLATADLSGLPQLPESGAIVVSDVTNPLLGPNGAAAVFGRQKGASERDVVEMDAALARFASLVGGPTEAPGAGAAGGTGFGLLAWGATLEPGAELVATTIGLADAIRIADVAVTGEGRFDAQSKAGKVPSFVLAAAHGHDVPVLLVAGAIQASTDDFAAALSLTDLAGSSATAIADPLPYLERAGEILARDRRADP